MRSTRFRLHVGIEGGRNEVGREGEKGVEGGKVAVRVLSVGSDAFLLVRLPSDARACLFTSPKYILHFKYATDILSHVSLPSVSPTPGGCVIVSWRSDVVVS